MLYVILLYEKSFKDSKSEKFYITVKSKKPPSSIHKVVLNDLKVPTNRLEKLKRDLQDYYSIRIDKQYRVIFKFNNGDAYDVSIVDYH